jgi:glc operon protein GlcG
MRDAAWCLVCVRHFRSIRHQSDNDGGDVKPFAWSVFLVTGVMFVSFGHSQTAPSAPAAATPPPAAQQPPPYGLPLSLEQAKKVMDAAEAEARKNGWPVAIAIVDNAAQLQMFRKLDSTQHASVSIAQGKAVTAVNFRRPTKALEDAIASGGAALRLLALQGVTPLEGGILIVVDGKIAGGIGVSGVTAAQDAQVARAGLEALSK